MTAMQELSERAGIGIEGQVCGDGTRAGRMSPTTGMVQQEIYATLTGGCHERPVAAPWQVKLGNCGASTCAYGDWC